MRFLALMPLEYSPEKIKEIIPNISFFEDLMKEKADETSKMSIMHSSARKYFMNLKNTDVKYDHLIHQINDIDESEAEIDILFLHGNHSHPLNCWKRPMDHIYDDKSLNPQIWLKDFLEDDIKPLKARILTGGYETFTLPTQYINQNIPEWSI